jgi:N-acetyl-gamma-glutamyl-phosphate reductase
MARGILSTIHLSLKEKLTSPELTAIVREFYAGSPFVAVLPEPFLPETKAVLGSNRCQIGARVDARTDQAIIVSVIDNLGKGMAGQAVQNMNLMFGLDETVGLTATGIWP